MNDISENNYMCTDCGYEKGEPFRICEKCGSSKVVSPEDIQDFTRCLEKMLLNN